MIESAIAFYRVRFSVTGLFENELYEGITRGLTQLREAGHRLWVVTSKPEVYAQRAGYTVPHIFYPLPASSLE